MAMKWAHLAAAFALLAAPQIVRAQETGQSAVTEAIQLRNAGRFQESVVLLKQHLRAYPNDGDAIRLLAQTQYWAKDFASARNTYERAVKLHPEDTSLQAQYAQFLAETATQRGWVRLSPAFHHDDQPLDRLELQAETGWFLQPGNSIAVQVTGMKFQLGDSASRNAVSAKAAFSHSDATSGLRIDLSGGVLHRSFDTANDLIGSGSVSIALNPALRLRGTVEREGYFYTEKSLSSPVMTNMGAAFLSLSSNKSWLGELSAQVQQFPDNNSMVTAYGWLLAPIAASVDRTIHVGYSGAYQNTNELRFQLERPQQAVSPASPNYNFAGRYSPYYTPLNLQTHSVIAALAFGLNSPAVFRLNGGYAIIGTENAPHFVPVALTAPARTEARVSITQRDTHPWNARTTLEFNSAGSSPLVFGAETSRTAFYSSIGAFAILTHKF